MFAQLLFPLPLYQSYTYKVDAKLDAQLLRPGMRALLPFNRRLETGIVLSTSSREVSRLLLPEGQTPVSDPSDCNLSFKEAPRLLFEDQSPVSDPLDYNLSSIDASAILDPQPIVNAEQLDLAFWMAEHYLCSPGEALFKMFPKGKWKPSFLERLWKKKSSGIEARTS